MPSWPVVGVGGIVLRDGKVLLVRRANPPYAGQWAIPGGKVQAGETLAEAVVREIFEETAIRVSCGELLYHFEHIERHDDDELARHYVVLDFAAHYLSGTVQAADDALEARWLSMDELSQWPINPLTRRALCELFTEQLEASFCAG